MMTRHGLSDVDQPFHDDVSSDALCHDVCRNLVQLPLDVLSIIAKKFLRAPKNMRLASKLFKEAVDTTVWKMRVFRYREDQHEEPWNPVKHFPFLKHIELQIGSFPQKWHYGRYHDGSMALMHPESLPLLRILSIAYVYWGHVDQNARETLKEGLALAINLQELSICDCWGVPGSFVNSLAHVKKLYLSHVHSFVVDDTNDGDTKGMCSLQRLIVDHCHKSTHMWAAKLFSFGPTFLPNLKEVVGVKLHGIATVRSLVALTTLTQLDVIVMETDACKCLDAMLLLPKLEKLNLLVKGFPIMPVEDFVPSSLEKAPCLEDVTLWYEKGPVPDWAGIRHSLSRMPGLRRLGLCDRDWLSHFPSGALH
jgi:hypothetical protein